MTLVSARRPCAALACLRALCALTPLAAHADSVAYDTFGPGDSFNPYEGYLTLGDNNFQENP